MASSIPSVIRTTTNRGVHLKIQPRPTSLGETREIMRLISQFGPIEYFKNLKYDRLSHPGTCLVIFRDQEAAKYCLSKSPIRFRMSRSGGTPRGDADAEEDPLYQIRVNSANVHFRDQIEMGVFHGNFMIDTKSAAQQDLAKRVPIAGLSDMGWKRDIKPWRIMIRQRERERTGPQRRRSLIELWEEGKVNAEGKGNGKAEMNQWTSSG